MIASRLRVTVFLACAVQGCVAVAHDISDDYDESSRRLCEVALGTPMSEIGVPQRSFSVETEGGTEARSSVSLCNGRIGAELVFDLNRRVYQIILSDRGQCFDGICIENSLGDARRRVPSLKPFVTAAEGGILSLRTESGSVHYNFDRDSIPIQCLRRYETCADTLSEARLEEIVIN